MFSNYQVKITSTIQKYAQQDWLISFEIAVDQRSTYLGFIKGYLEFIDNSCLFFKEYLNLELSQPRISYSFHYQDSQQKLLFRYDNAKHKPDLGYVHHKHTENKIIPSEIPELEDVISEIINAYVSKL